MLLHCQCFTINRYYLLRQIFPYHLHVFINIYIFCIVLAGGVTRTRPKSHKAKNPRNSRVPILSIFDWLRRVLPSSSLYLNSYHFAPLQVILFPPRLILNHSLPLSNATPLCPCPFPPLTTSRRYR